MLPQHHVASLRFVSDDVWGSRGVCRVVSRSIAVSQDNLVRAWDVSNRCNTVASDASILDSLSLAVLPLVAALEGRAADGIDAMA
jgi:hypothetical protein